MEKLACLDFLTNFASGKANFCGHNGFWQGNSTQFGTKFGKKMGAGIFQTSPRGIGEKMKQKREIEWSKLDNYSKIFPASWSLKDPKVFRLSCELFEAVEPGFLQRALDAVMNDFPL